MVAVISCRDPLWLRYRLGMDASMRIMSTRAWATPSLALESLQTQRMGPQGARMRLHLVRPTSGLPYPQKLKAQGDCRFLYATRSSTKILTGFNNYKPTYKGSNTNVGIIYVRNMQSIREKNKYTYFSSLMWQLTWRKWTCLRLGSRLKDTSHVNE